MKEDSFLVCFNGEESAKFFAGVEICQLSMKLLK
jgi:hypothetical protein